MKRKAYKHYLTIQIETTEPLTMAQAREALKSSLRQKPLLCNTARYAERGEHRGQYYDAYVRLTSTGKVK